MPNQPAAKLNTVDAVTQAQYDDDEYAAAAQAKEREQFVGGVRSATGRQQQRQWAAMPALNPPPLLADVCVVLIGPKKPGNCGVVARALSSFETADLRIVAPRCDHNTRTSRSVSKGAQYVLWRARVSETLGEALDDVDLAVAFTRWLPPALAAAGAQQAGTSGEAAEASGGSSGNQQPGEPMLMLPDVPSLLAHPTMQAMLQQQPPPPTAQKPQQEQEQGQQPQEQAGHQQQQGQQEAQQQQQRRPPRVALVFGREEFGLSDAEVAACDVACAISIGRLQESLSLSHAVAVVLSQLYQARLSAVTAAAAAAEGGGDVAAAAAAAAASGAGGERKVASPSPYVAASATQLAAGVADAEGVER